MKGKRVFPSQTKVESENGPHSLCFPGLLTLNAIPQCHPSSHVLRVFTRVTQDVLGNWEVCPVCPVSVPAPILGSSSKQSPVSLFPLYSVMNSLDLPHKLTPAPKTPTVTFKLYDTDRNGILDSSVSWGLCAGRGACVRPSAPSHPSSVTCVLGGERVSIRLRPPAPAL